MKIENVIKYFLFGSLVVGIILPLTVLLSIKDKSLAGQIGDTLGGTTAPFVNIAAILVVLLTYMYQKRNDRRNAEKELINSLYQNLKEELLNINHQITNESKGVKQTTTYCGADAIRQIVRDLNNEIIPLNDITEFQPYNAIVNIYRYFNSFLGTVHENVTLYENEKKLILNQLSLFYRNNLYIAKEQRGEAVCKFHGKTHEFPAPLLNEIIQIEEKIV